MAPVVIEAMHKAVDEMADEKTFRGYPPETGYDFIIEKILKHDYTDRGIKMDKSEIFLSDGAKSDCGNIGDIFAVDNKVATREQLKEWVDYANAHHSVILFDAAKNCRIQMLWWNLQPIYLVHQVQALENVVKVSYD